MCDCTDSITNGQAPVVSGGTFTQPLANLVVSNSLTVTNVFATGNVSAARFYGDGSGLTNIIITQPIANLVVSNSVTTSNLITPNLEIFNDGNINGITLKTDSYGGVAIGLGSSLSGANGSFALGPNALNSATQIGPDIAIGSGTLGSDANTGYNIAIGTYAMFLSSPINGFNTAIGYNSLGSDTGYGLNTAIGNSSMTLAVPQQGNDVAIGNNSLRSDNDGFNTAIGSESLYNLVHGMFNTSIGYQSSFYTNGLSNTVAIGAFASPGASNVAVFAPLVNVGINTNLPTSTLEVTGNVYVSNAVVTNRVYASGNVSAAYFYGNGSAISGIQSSNISQPFANIVVSNSLSVTNIFASRNVGIGTTMPGAQLDVVSSSTPDSGALISQFGSTSQSGRIKFYDNNVGTVIPPYIYGDAGPGLGISGLGPVKIFGGSFGPGDPGQQVMEVGLGYTNILGSLQAFGQAGDGVIFTQFIESTGTPHNYIFSSDGSVGAYTLGVNDNDISIKLSSAPKCMVNLTRLENNDENNFHVEFVNRNQNSAHGDYGVGMGFYDNGQQEETISQSPFIINTHVTPWDSHAQVPFLGASDTTSTAIAIAMDGNRNVGINTIPPIQTSGQPVPRYGQLQVATYSNGIDMYTLQVFDNGTPDNKSANAMTALTRTELNTAHPSATDPQPQYHLEFINQPAGSNSYGVGMGFYADPEITGSQPFIISAHSQIRGFDDTRNSNGSLDILGSITLATDGSGHVGIGGQLFPAYALDVTGTVNATNSLVTTNVFASNISASGSFGTSGQVLSQTGTGLGWINIPVSVAVHPVTSGSYSVLISDYYIGCNGTGITIVLPLGSTIFTGKQYVIKDESGNAVINHITVNGNGNLIDGNSSFSIVVNYLSLRLVWTGSRWSIV